MTNIQPTGNQRSSNQRSSYQQYGGGASVGGNLSGLESSASDPSSIYTSSEPRVYVDGAPLVEPVASKLIHASIDTSAFAPDQIQLSFRDPNRDVLVEGGFVVGGLVAVTAVGTSGVEVPITDGEITAVELDFDATSTNTVVRALDLSNRLYRGRKTRTFVESLASEMVEEILTENGLEESSVIPTDVLYQQMVQPNVSDWQFIRYLASLSGYLAYQQNGVFYFGPPIPAETGPPPGPEGSSDPRALVLGKNLLRVKAVIRSAEQVSGVSVLGFDQSIESPVVSVGVPETEATEIATQPEEIAALFGAQVLFHHGPPPMANEDEGEALAEAIGMHLAAALAEIEGEAMGNPLLTAGTAVGLRSAGMPFDGNYTLTSAVHTWDPHNAYTVTFNASGLDDRSMLSLAGGHAPAKMPAMNGLVTAVVTDIQDPEEQGRVTLMFPWLSDTYVSDWAPVCQASAGIGSGFLVLPDVGSVAVVAFEQGDFNRPIVLGAVYNDVHEALPEGMIDPDGLVIQRRLMSSERNQVTLCDGEELSGIYIATGDEAQEIIIDQNEATIVINSEGTITIAGASLEINAEGDVSVTAEGDISLTTEGELSFTASSINMTADADITITTDGVVNVAGSEVGIEADSLVSAEAPLITLNG
ncbi:MAG: VgrG-related protein [Acidimicrobiales bacterium]